MNSFRALFVVLLLLLPMSLQAQPSRDRVLGDVEFSEHPEAVDIEVTFNFPVRYIRHFPVNKGDELRIQLAPIEIAAVDREALFHRESHTPARPNLAGLDEVVYEGDMFSGLHLTLYFLNPARWQVEQGADFRSLKVRVLAPFPVVPKELISD